MNSFVYFLMLGIKARVSSLLNKHLIASPAVSGYILSTSFICNHVLFRLLELPSPRKQD